MQILSRFPGPLPAGRTVSLSIDEHVHTGVRVPTPRDEEAELLDMLQDVWHVQRPFEVYRSGQFDQVYPKNCSLLT